MTKGRVLAALFAAIALVFVVQAGASAQYPPPKGNLYSPNSGAPVDAKTFWEDMQKLKMDSHGGRVIFEGVVSPALSPSAQFWDEYTRNVMADMEHAAKQDLSAAEAVSNQVKEETWRDRPSML